MQQTVALVLESIDRVRVSVGQDFRCQLIPFCDKRDLTLRSKRFCNQVSRFLVILLMISDFIVSSSFDFCVSYVRFCLCRTCQFCLKRTTTTSTLRKI